MQIQFATRNAKAHLLEMNEQFAAVSSHRKVKSHEQQLPDDTMFHFSTSRTIKLPVVVAVSMNNRDLRMEVDTGAGLSITIKNTCLSSL